MVPNLAVPAALIGDPTRAAILMALADGRAQPASALAYAANVSPQAASNHLAKLAGGGLLAVETQGRHRYYRLAGPEVGAALEALASLAPAVRSLAEPRTPEGRRLRFARSCYGHLAGRLAVAMTAAMERQGLLETARGDGADARSYRVSAAGQAWFAALGIAVDGPRRLPARRCLDWTERRHHLAGPLGSRLFARLVELGWIARAGNGRAVRLTAAGAAALAARLGLEAEALVPDAR
ncbi:MAG: winged helix-turn-helix transcriptional regulator [Rhodospirillaceae bacterium]|nr:winged helix-turn-helix transcriptional regulator [Rhodospirillaceae bacterium]